MKKNGLQIITRRMVIFNTPCCIWQLVAQVGISRSNSLSNNFANVFFKHYSYLGICFIICGFSEAFKIQSLLFYPIFISYIRRRSKRRILQKKERNKNLK